MINRSLMKYGNTIIKHIIDILKSSIYIYKLRINVCFKNDELTVY